MGSGTMVSEYICGVNAVFEAIRAEKRRVFEVYISGGKKQIIAESIVDLAKRRKIPVHFVDRQRIRELSKVEKNQGVTAKVASFEYSTVDSIVSSLKSGDSGGFVVLLDEVLDPQNLGSLIRTAHLVGAAGVILPKDRAASIGPAAMRASAGATEYLPIARVTNVANVLKMLKNEGFWIVGAAGESDKILYDYDFTGSPHVLVLGGEGKGIRRLVRENCDAILSIPMKGEVGSYNVSVAGAIIMSEVARQLRKKT